MLPSGFTTYYSKQVDIITANYLAACEEPSSESIHDFRVAVKRTRTFIRTIRHTIPSALENVRLKKLRRVYKASGCIRDVHVQIELIDKTLKKTADSLNGYIDYLRNSQQDGENKFEKACDRFNLRLFEKIERNVRIAADKYPEKEIIRSVQNYLARSLNELTRNIDHAEQTNREFYRLHNVRKHAKRSRYIVELLQTLPDATDDLESLNKQLRNVHRALGKWHDAAVGTQLLARYRRQHRKVLRVSGGIYADYRSALKQYADQALEEYDTALAQLLQNLSSQAVA